MRGANGLGERGFQRQAMENVVTEHQANRLVADEAFANQQSVRNAAGDFLHLIGDIDAPAGTVAQQTVEGAFFSGRDDDEDIPNTGLHEHGKRIINHGFVIDRQQWFAGRAGHGVESGAFPGCENDAFHGSTSSPLPPSWRHGIQRKGWVFFCGRHISRPISAYDNTLYHTVRRKNNVSQKFKKYQQKI